MTSYLLVTDTGQEWDDQGMLDLAIRSGIRRAYVLCLSGDTVARAKIAERTVHAMAEDCEVEGDTVSFSYGGEGFTWRFFCGVPSAETIVYGSDLVDFSFLIPTPWEKAASSARAGWTWAVLLATLPFGARICDVPGEIVQTVFVGDDPRGKDSGLSLDRQREVEENLNELGRSGRRLTFLPSKVLRSVFATVSDMNELSDLVRYTLLRSARATLLEGLPWARSAEHQMRSVKDRARKLTRLVDAVGTSAYVDPLVYLGDARAYATSFHELGPEERRALAAKAAEILALEAHVRKVGDGEDAEAVRRFLRKAKASTQLLPMDSMTGLEYLKSLVRDAMTR